MKTLTLSKPPHLHVLRYEEGSEAMVLDAMIGMVNSPDVSFDWWDAAQWSHQVGVELAKELKAYIPAGDPK